MTVFRGWLEESARALRARLPDAGELPPLEAASWALIILALGVLPVRLAFPGIIPLWTVLAALGIGLGCSFAEERRRGAR